ASECPVPRRPGRPRSTYHRDAVPAAHMVRARGDLDRDHDVHPPAPPASTMTSAPREIVACLQCRSSSQRPLYRAWPSIVRCRDCGFVYMSPRPTRAALEELYTHEYFENSASQQLGYDNYVADRELVERTFTRRLEEIERRFVPERGRLLDVG